MPSKLPLDRKHLNVLWNHFAKPSYRKRRPHTHRQCIVDKQQYFQLYMNQIIFMKEKYPNTDGKLCMYCEQPMTFISAREKTRAQKRMKLPKKIQRVHINTNMSIDRLNPLRPYEKGNIVFCCAGCNKRKNAVTPADVLNIMKVYEEMERLTDRSI